MQDTQEMRDGSLGREGPLEEEMATHSSILAWEIPRTEKPSEVQPMCHKESDPTEHACTADTTCPSLSKVLYLS